MFSHLLVPLDGSRLAEAVLPATILLARRLKARVTLLHIVEPDAPVAVHGEPHLTSAAEAEVYLDKVAERLHLSVPDVQRHVHQARQGDVARTIVDHTAEMKADLVVLCTHGGGHGRGGLRGLVFGSIAQQVLQQGTTPVFLLKPTQAGKAPPFVGRKLFVPLDGTPEHEMALPVATSLAQAFNSALHLVVVIPTLMTLPGEQAAIGMLMPMAMRAVLSLAERGAAEYLQEVLARLDPVGLALSAEVCRGDPAPAVVEAANRAGADLIVMASHGTAGLSAFWSDSVTRKVVSRFVGPLLLVPTAETMATPSQT